MERLINGDISTVGITGEGPEFWAWVHPPLDVPEGDVFFENRVFTEYQIQFSVGYDDPISMIKFDQPDYQGRSPYEQATAAALAIADKLRLLRGEVQLDRNSADALAA